VLSKIMNIFIVLYAILNIALHTCNCKLIIPVPMTVQFRVAAGQIFSVDIGFYEITTGKLTITVYIFV